MMKASIHDVGKDFCFHLTLMEYTNRYYQPAMENAHRLKVDGYGKAQDAADYLELARREWNHVAVEDVGSNAKPVMERGDKVRVDARVKLGALDPAQVLVELYHGPVSSTGDIYHPVRVEMKAGVSQGGAYDYSVEIVCETTGQHGYSVRILPRHEALVHPFIPGLVRWA
jgi:starch phosphorylase